MPKPFFFSYARNDDRDPHLKRFLESVNAWVRSLTGAEDDGFLDTADLRGGEMWSNELVQELRMSPAMVCAYSPSYFNSQICGREMQVFLDRRLSYIRENPGRPPANVVPVLWVAGQRLVPASLPDIEYVRPMSQRHENDGVRDVMAIGDEKEQQSIAREVALRIRDAHQVVLPDLDFTPTLEGLDSAFEPPPLPPPEFDTVGANRGPDCVTYVYARSPRWDDWPFAPRLKPVLHLSAAVAKGRHLHLHQLSFDPAAEGLVPRLKKLREQNNRVIVLVDGQSLCDPAVQGRMREYDAENIDASSTLVVWPSGARPGTAENLIRETFPTLSCRRPPDFFSNIQSDTEFVDAVRKSVDSLRNRLLRRPQGIAPLAPTSAFATLPTVGAPGGRPGG